MLSLIYGGFTSARSNYIYTLVSESLKAGNECILVVPEGDAVNAERRMTELTRDFSALGLEVMNFDKLSETVFRKCGSLSLSFISDGAKKLILSKTLSELSPALTEFTARHDDSAYVTKILSAITELKYASITPTALSRAAKEIEAAEEDNRLCRKVNELALIFSAYNATLGEFGGDSTDDLTKCAELIRADKPFSGKKIFFDAFLGYTAQEYGVIESLMSTGADITISLCNPGNDDTSEVFAFTNDTAERLVRIAKKCGTKIEYTYTDIADGYESEAIAYLSKNYSLVKTQDSGSFGKTEDVNIISCADLFDECEICAAKVADAVRHGLRYRDIGIIIRDTDKYRGIIDLALERFGIPCFFSSKCDITEKSLIRFITSAVTICKSGARFSDIITYIRCGLTSLSENDADLIESYASSWKISGNIWFNDEGFNMNPRGYMPLTQKDADKLDRINTARLELMAPLAAFMAELKGCKTVRNYAKAISDFVTDMNICEKLAARSLLFESRGESILAKEEEGLYAALSSALDELVRALGECECTCDEFMKYFAMILSDTDIGTIPQSHDVVTISDAATHRTPGLKHIFMLGCNEGEFPKSTAAPSILSLEERRILSEHKLEEIEYDPVLEAEKELFFFFSAAVSASKKITLTYRRRGDTGEELKASTALSQVKALFDDIETVSDQIAGKDRIFTKDGLVEHLPYLERGLLKKLTSLVSEDIELAEIVSRASRPISKRNEKLSASVAKQIHNGNLYLSQSITDSYSNCPFSYRCKYTLGLREKNTPELSRSDMGTVVHSVLDDFMKNELQASVKDGKADREYIYEKIREITEKRTELLLAFTSEEKRARSKRLLERMAEITAHSAADLADEFAQSGFKATFFELPISEKSKDGDSILPIRMTLEDGSFVLLGGIADRVDTMAKGSKLYVRVADYKTGKRAFSLENIRQGLSLQLLIYLFSIWDNADELFKLKAGADKDAEVIPAGAEYVMTTPDKKGLPTDTEEFDLANALSKAFKRSGIYLADETVLKDMDAGLSGRFIPVNSKLNATGSSVLASFDELNDLKDEVSGILLEIAEGIKKGDAKIAPLPPSPDRKVSACAYCPMKPVCKNISIEEEEAED